MRSVSRRRRPARRTPSRLRIAVAGAAAAGVGHGIAAYIAPNTHAQLESFYAVPQLGAVLVPINYRLPPTTSRTSSTTAARKSSAHSDHLNRLSIRSEPPNVEYFVALEGARDGWLDYESRPASATPHTSSRDRRERPSASTTPAAPLAPEGRHDHHRNAYMNIVGTLVHISMTPADTYL
jgi:fatty-acyl-CoA synthase